MSRKSIRKRPSFLQFETLEDRTTPTGSPVLRSPYTFSGPSFGDNSPLLATPAAPSLAVGKTNEVALTEAQIQVRSIPNGSPSQTSLTSFFAPTAPNGATVWSNPLTVYDPYNDRFVVAALGTVSANSTSVLFIAVSTNGTASTSTANWRYQTVNLATTINGQATYAEYMGLGLDQQAVYVTTSQTSFSGNVFQDARVIILDKTIGANGGWYGGGTATTSGLLDPDSNSANDSQYYGLVPATMFTTPTAPGSGVGTYLVAYNGSPGAGANESVRVVEIDNPTSSPTFITTQIDVGDIDDTSTGLPLAPEPHTGSNGSSLDINPGPRRTGNAVWRDNRLYFAATVKASGADAVHWFQVLTTDNTVEKQSNVDTSALATGLYAYNPAVAVDLYGDLGVAYAVSNASRGVQGAYSTRTPTDTGATMRDPVALTSATTNEYIRRDANGNNFWGPDSAITVDPTSRLFWTFNASADSPSGTGTAPDLGRWLTLGGAFSFNWPPDATTIPNINTQDDVQPFNVFLNQYFSDLETTSATNFTYSVVSSDPSIAQVAMTSQQVMQVTIPRPTVGTTFIFVTCTDSGTPDAPPASTTSVFTIHVQHVDHPAQVTIDQAVGQPDPTNGASILYDVVFDQDVTGFSGNGVALSGTAPGNLQAAVTQIDGAHYTVTVTGMTGDGTVDARVKANAAFNPSNQGNLDSTSTDSEVTVDYTPPAVTIDQDPAQADPTNGSIKFDVQFSEPVSAFDGSMVALSGTAGGPLSKSVVAGVAPFSYVVTVTGMSSSGTVIANVNANAVTDLAGNGNAASTSTDNTVLFDNVQPTATIVASAGQSPNVGGTSVSFDVQFSEPILNFTANKVNLAASTTGGTLVASIAPGVPANSYVITVTGMAAAGNVVASIPAGLGVVDLAGNANLASGSATVAYVHSGSVQFSAASYSIDEKGAPNLTVTVTRTGGTDGILTVDYAAIDGTAVLGTDYGAPSGTGTLTFAAGNSTSQSFTIPILDNGVFANDNAFSVALSNISQPGALGTPVTAAVNINKEAVFDFSVANYAVTEADGSVTVTVHRGFGTHGAVSVNYATGGGTATGGTGNPGDDYQTTSGTLNWADGDTADKSFNIPIFTDTISEGRETIGVTLSTPGGNSELGTQAASTVTIAASNGVGPGTFLNTTTGDLVTVKLAGPGTLTYFLTNGNAPISEIDLSGTDPTKSTLSLTIKKAKGSIGRVEIGEIDGTGVKSMSLAAADLTGAGINLTSYLGALTIGAIQNGADITLAGLPPKANQFTKITAGVIDDGTDITITGAPLGSLTATSIGVGNISAPSVGTITVKGKAKTKTTPAIPGDFKSNLTIEGIGLAAKVPALKVLKVLGTVSGSTISIGGSPGTVGDVGTVSVGSFVNSRLFAGYSGPDDGTGAFNLPSTVKVFTVTGKTNAFFDSYVIATNFNSVSLGSVDPTITGTKFGVTYHSVLKALSVKSTKFKFDPKGGPIQDMPSSDFEVKKV